MSTPRKSNKALSPTQFPSRHRYFIYGSLGLLAFSGLCWLVSNYLIEGHEGWGNVALESQFWALKFHGAGMMLFLLALGSSLNHVLAGFQERKHKAMGIGLITIFGLMIVTGWLIYYGPSGDSHDWISVAHWSFGLLACAAFIGHIANGKKGKRRR